MNQRTPVTIDNPVYVTQWAVTHGVLKFTEGEIVDGGYFSAGRNYAWVFTRDWTYVQAIAEKRVQDALRKKIESTEKSLVKLRKLLEKPVQIKDWAP